MIQLNLYVNNPANRYRAGVPAVVLFSASLLLCLLAACTPAPVRPRVQGTESLQLARESMLAARSRWTFTGRVAVSSSGNAGNARIDWKQDGADYDIRLSAPITGQGWRLRRVGPEIRLEGLEGGTRTGTDAEALLQTATGWRIPVSAMAAWVRGTRATGATADLEFDPAGLPATMMQSGWSVEYRGWTEAGLPLPTRVFASQPGASVRLVIERWSPP